MRYGSSKVRVFGSPTEKKVEAACDRIMAALGYTLVRFSQPRHTMQTAGIPDRRYYNPFKQFEFTVGHAFWFECKRPGGRVRPAQKAFRELAESCGEDYVLGGSDELLAYLQQKGVIKGVLPSGAIQR